MHLTKGNIDNDKMTEDEIRQHTTEDEDLQLLQKWIAGNENKSANSNLFNWFITRQDRFAEIDGMVYLCEHPTTKHKDFQWEQARIMLPKSLQPKAVRLAHSHPLNGHRGVMAMYRSIARQYAWNGLFLDVMRFCRKCDSCQS